MDRVPRRIRDQPRERCLRIVAGLENHPVSPLHDDAVRGKASRSILAEERRRRAPELRVGDHHDVLQDIGLSFRIPDRPGDRDIDLY